MSSSLGAFIILKSIRILHDLQETTSSQSTLPPPRLSSKVQTAFMPISWCFRFQCDSPVNFADLTLNSRKTMTKDSGKSVPSREDGASQIAGDSRESVSSREDCASQVRHEHIYRVRGFISRSAADILSAHGLVILCCRQQHRCRLVQAAQRKPPRRLKAPRIMPAATAA